MTCTRVVCHFFDFQQSETKFNFQFSIFNFQFFGTKRFQIIVRFLGAALLAILATAMTPVEPVEPTALSESLYANPDSMNLYASRVATGDARAQFVMACSYHYRLEHKQLSRDITCIRTRKEADRLLQASAAQGYEPAIRLLRCLERNCPVEVKP